MIAICVGHSRPNDSGAASVTGVTEWDYNSQLADMIGENLKTPIKFTLPTRELVTGVL